MFEPFRFTTFNHPISQLIRRSTLGIRGKDMEREWGGGGREEQGGNDEYLRRTLLTTLMFLLTIRFSRDGTLLRIGKSSTNIMYQRGSVAATINIFLSDSKKKSREG